MVDLDLHRMCGNAGCGRFVSGRGLATPFGLDLFRQDDRESMANPPATTETTEDRGRSGREGWDPNLDLKTAAMTYDDM